VNSNYTIHQRTLQEIRKGDNAHMNRDKIGCQIESFEDKVPLEAPSYLPDINEYNPTEKFRWIDGPTPANDTLYFEVCSTKACECKTCVH